MDRRDFIKTISLIGGVNFVAPFLKNNSLLANDIQPPIITGIEVYNKLISQAQQQNWHLMPIGELITRVGMFFIKTPYLSHTLEQKQECVVINFSGVDCVTFVENTLNIARQIKDEKYNINDLIERIRYTRYRNGILTDYTSRLHYTSDWIADNIKKNVITNITQELGSEEHKFNFNFMSKNYNLYHTLKNDKTGKLKEQIIKIENELNTRSYYIIPNNKIRTIQNKLQDGDIIAIAISTDGLDYGHLGIVFNKRLLHASSKQKEVVLDQSIYKYVIANKKNIGISVIRAI